MDDNVREYREWSDELTDLGYPRGWVITYMMILNGRNWKGEPVCDEPYIEHTCQPSTPERRLAKREALMRLFVENDEQFATLDPEECIHYSEILKRRAER